MQDEQYQNLNYTAQLRGDVSTQQQQQLIRELTVRFKDKPRVCKKANDSLIGSSKRILYIHEDTFYYHQMIQEFQDLDVGKLQYSIPKAGIKLTDIVSLAFPPRKKKDKNYFSITVPKNKILKYGKNKEIVIDPKAKGQLTWTFVFTYDIVSLPQREERVRKQMARQNELLQKQKEIELREKQRIEKEEAERRSQQQQRQKKFESFLMQKESIKEEDVQVLKSRQNRNKDKERNEAQVEVGETAADKKRLQHSYEFHFNNVYRTLSSKLSTSKILEIEYKLFEIIGNFRILAIQNTKLLINQMIFNKSIRAYRQTSQRGYYINQMWIKLGGKNVNLQFLGMSTVADILASLKKNRGVDIRVPLATLIKYKGYKALCVMNTPMNGDETVIYGLPNEGSYKINSSISDELKDICKGLNLKPFSSQVRFSNVTVYLDPRCQVHETENEPYMRLSGGDSQNSKYNDRKIIYITNLKEIFPIDIDLENSINQIYVRLRPQYIHSINEQPLSSGAFLYSMDNADGEVEDLTVAKASQSLRYKAIPNFVKKLDNLDILLIDSKNIINALHSDGINMRYLGKIAKLTELPYIKQMMHIQMMSRCIKKLFRQQQGQYIQDGFRNAFPDLYKQIHKESEKRSKMTANMKEIQAQSAYLNLKKKEIMEKFVSVSKNIAIDFLNLVFGSTEETYIFWQIIKNQCLQIYEVEIDILPTVTSGALLHAVLYHCGLHVRYDLGIGLFMTQQPFKQSDWVAFAVQSQVYEFPSFEIQKKAHRSKELLINNDQKDLGVNSLNLQLLIQRALRSSEHYQHCAQPQQSVLVRLSNYTKIRQPEGPPYHPSLLPYFIANITEENFLKAHKIAEFCLPLTHPLYITFYMAYSKLYDKEVLYKSALLVAMKGLGVSHWKTCELLSMADVGNLDSLRKAWISSKQSSGMAVLSLIRRLYEVGRLDECLQYSSKGYMIFLAQGQKCCKDMNELLEIAIKSAYQMREIDRMLQYTEKMWKHLQAYDRDNLDMYYLVYWYSLKVFLQTSHMKKYYYKLILVLRDHIINEKANQQRLQRSSDYSQSKQQQQKDNLPPSDLTYFPEATGDERKEIIAAIIVLSRESKYHLDWIKSILNKLEYGYKTLNFAKNFFTKFQQHLDHLHNQDLEQGLQYLYMLGRLFGQKYFEDALITGIFFAVTKDRFWH